MVASDDLQQYVACVHQQQDTFVVSALFPVTLFVKHFDDVNFPLLRKLSPSPNADGDMEHHKNLEVVRWHPVLIINAVGVAIERRPSAAIIL